MDRKPPGQWLLNVWMPSLVFNVLVLLFNLALWGKIPLWGKNGILLTVTGLFMLGCVWWWWLAFRAQTRKYSIVVPKYRIDAPDFWKRNADKIVIAVISAIVGGLLTLLIKVLTAKGP